MDRGYKYFDLDLPIRGAVLGSELRKAVAMILGRRTKEVKLQQGRAKRKSDGAAVVNVEGGGGVF